MTMNNNRLNKYKYPGAKRLMLEAQELKDNTEDYCAQPIDDNLFEWHFTLRGPSDTAFEGGFYHGRLSFPTEYPMKPPSIILLTPNGRFETNKKICLSISGYHPETWQPSWSVRTALLALIAFMPTKANRAIGSLDFNDVERRKLAMKSRSWSCETCGLIKDLLKEPESQKQESCTNDSQADSCRPGTSRDSAEDVDDKKDSLQNDSSDRVEGSNITSDMKSDSLVKNNRGEREKSTTPTADNQDSTINQDSRRPPEGQISSGETGRGVESNGDQERLSPAGSNREQPARAGGMQNLQPDRRRLYPPSVFKSICIVLSLLLLRRVVMVLQSA